MCAGTADGVWVTGADAVCAAGGTVRAVVPSMVFSSANEAVESASN
jgi:hypothetical protein